MTLRRGKSLACRVILLDDKVPEFSLSKKSYGEELFAQVVKHLQLLEADYFGLEYKSKTETDAWLDREKLITHQVGRDHDLSFKFKVKFYTPDPHLLEDEFTRYLFALQIKQDLASGRLSCTVNTTAMLSAYIAQGELGDYSAEEMPDHTYLKCISFAPNQSDELEQLIMQFHQGFGGMTPDEADSKLLDTARKTDYYGIILYPAQDHEDVPLQLTVTDSGIFVFQNKQKINTFSWAKIRKLSFKRKRFLIKLHPAADQGYYKNIVEFFFTSRNESKMFWKLAIEHHGFYRLREVAPVKKHRRAVLTRGSSFRYTGRTQKQLLDHVKESHVKGSRSFERTLSTRHTVAGNRSWAMSASTTLNSKKEFQQDASTLSSGSHLLAGSDSQHSGFKSAASPAASPLSRSGAASSSPPIMRPVPPITTGIDRKQSEPVLGARLDINMDDYRLSRTPEYTNIPEKVEEPPEILPRSDSVTNIPEEVEEDAHAEPTRLMHTNSLREVDLSVELGSPDVADSSGSQANVSHELASPSNMMPGQQAMMRVHSENDTTGHIRVPHVNNHSADIEPQVIERQQPVPEVNSNHNQFSLGSTELLNGRSDKGHTLPENKKPFKKLPTDKAYFIAKELLMTERTYHKDLAIVMIHFREYVTSDNAAQSTLSRLYETLQPLYTAHCEFLEQLENRMSQCDSKISDCLTIEVGDLVCEHFNQIEYYKNYLIGLEEILTDLVKCSDTNIDFGAKLHEFETEKMCYLPVFNLVLKPAHRLVYYEIVLSKLVGHYSSTASDYSDCKQALSVVTEVLGSLRSIIAELENTEKLVELQQDVGGVEELVHQGRYFIREGCLQKLSRRGYQQRLFLLLSDVLLYTSRTQSSQLQFKVHGYMPLSGMSLEESDPNVGAANGFTIYGSKRCLIVAANSQEEKDKWLEDLNFAISIANSDQIELAEMPLPSINPPNNQGQDADDMDTPPSPDKSSQVQHRANTTMHVCWHRNTSVSIKDIQNAIKHQLSGYLLRKFKNSNGWQKLWVVFTNFCLFFYKTYQDECPLASLPLLGYSVSKPSASDGINKDFVFKLQFKNHIYFFRAESEYTYDRWMEVINSATHSARRTRMFSRADSMS
ncbi:FERM, ARHGEF and pleckstrin domain-containing protein 2-like isoform X2 [Watersipora subatra]|uniref:FERM, ARHGEF and pleckstrin domain-containing protein 2-like isoform X2 n=1 Tax=Watersipora subatra TaxID=2589382 RepID=UPI00355B1F5B